MLGEGGVEDRRQAGLPAVAAEADAWDAVANATWWPALPIKEQLLSSVHSTPV